MPNKKVKKSKPKPKPTAKPKAVQHPKPLMIPKKYEERKDIPAFNESEFISFVYGLTPQK